MSLPDDILCEEIWKYLTVATLLKYCCLNKTLNSICNRNETWQYLIERDFNIDYIGDEANFEYRCLYNFEEIDFNESILWQGGPGRFIFDQNQKLMERGNYGFSAIMDHFLNIGINTNIYLSARELIDFFRKKYNIPKSFQHELDDSQLFTTSLSELVGNTCYIISLNNVKNESSRRYST